METFEIQDIKCIDSATGEQGLLFIGKDRMIQVNLGQLDPKQHDERFCKVACDLWNGRNCDATVNIIDL